jgi:sugar lactone lactonase YvrE
VLKGVGYSKGMAFSSGKNDMYYTDSFARTIYLFNYDEDVSSPGNQCIFVRTRKADGLPGRATLDIQDCLWSAQWDGSSTIRPGPDGKEDRRITSPIHEISSLTFGGDDYYDMHVTTATGQYKAEEGQYAGSLFWLISILGECLSSSRGL